MTTDGIKEEPSDQVGTRLLFENERVRVWDLSLAPGESLATHIHRDDFFFVVASGGSLSHIDPDDPAKNHDITFEDGEVVFVEAGEGIVHNRLVNKGTTYYRNFVVELKGPKTRKE